MTFLDNAPRFLFFTGKGGVGKTSLACASALKLAEQGRRVLLVSTDPASNIGQVFGVTIGHRIVPLPGVKRVDALEIDPQAAAQGYRNRIIDPVRDALPPSVLKNIEEQLSGACTTEIAAFDEFTALLADSLPVRAYDHIVFDTAPTGHTIRLLKLPGAWSGFLDTQGTGASCLGPLAGLEKQRTQYKAAVLALADPARTRFILVARAQRTALDELARTRAEFAAAGLAHAHLVINGLLPAQEGEQDPLAAAIAQREQAALAALPAGLQALPCDHIPLKPFNLVGVEALRTLLSPAPAPVAPARAAPPPPAGTVTLASLTDAIAADGRGLILLMGKGGVGKTTLAAAIAVNLARRGYPVHLTTSDPAAHLGTTLAGTTAHLTVSRIDPAVETERYRAHVLATRGASLDAEGRALLEEDLRSPCTTEIAVFQAFARTIEAARTGFVVLDTAPTGHTLLLLDATGAYDRESARHRHGDAQASPMRLLQDPRQTKVLLVTLAEATPVLEAAHLQDDLHRAGITPFAWVINQSLAASHPRSALLQNRAESELSQIARVLAGKAPRVAIVPFAAEEPTGIGRLAALAVSAPGASADSDHRTAPAHTAAP